MPTIRRRLTAALVGVVVVSSGAVGLASPSQAATGPELCAAMTTTVYQANDPQLHRTLLTRWEGEGPNTSRYGFTNYLGGVMKAGGRQGTGLTPIHRMYHSKRGDFKWIPDGSNEMRQAMAGGYSKGDVDFYASRVPLDCTSPVYRIDFNGRTTYTNSSQERAKLMAQGGKDGRVAFYTNPSTSTTPTPTPPPGPDADGKFSLAVYGDTQMETEIGDTRIKQRSDWVVAQRESRDIRHVLHSGDITNWGWLVQSQYDVAEQGMDPLTKAGIKYSLSPGNHDTRVVGSNGVGREYGGSAYVNNPECVERLGAAKCHSWLLVRETQEFNQNFKDKVDTQGAFEAGKAGNVYTTFKAAGENWLVLTLELWPRKEVITWANGIVKANQDKNVIILTHMYLDGTATVTDSNGGYGATSPKYLYDNLVVPNANVKMLFNGHTGKFAHNLATTPSGQKFASYLNNYTAPKPGVAIRMVEIDVKAGSITSSLVDIKTGQSVPDTESTFIGMDFDR